jgi:hypothetical protein
MVGIPSTRKILGILIFLHRAIRGKAKRCAIMWRYSGAMRLLDVDPFSKIVKKTWESRNGG